MDESSYFLWSVISAGITALSTLGLAVAAAIAGRVALKHLNAVKEQLQATSAQLQLDTANANRKRSTATHEALKRFERTCNQQHQVLVSCARQVSHERYGGKSPTGNRSYTPQEMMSTEEAICNFVPAEALRAMNTILNELEHIAVFSGHQIYSDRIIHDVMHNLVSYISEMSALYIQLHREGKVPGYRREPEAYIAIDQLCIRLKEIRQENRYSAPEQTSAWRGYE